MAGWRDEFLPDHCKRKKDPKAIAEARRGHCEFCSGPVKPEQVHVHHVSSRGAGGGDVAGNLVSLCWICHNNAHTGRISRARIMAFVVAREWLWRLLGGKTCKCGSDRFRYLEATRAFECRRCLVVFTP